MAPRTKTIIGLYYQTTPSCGSLCFNFSPYLQPFSSKTQKAHLAARWRHLPNISWAYTIELPKLVCVCVGGGGLCYDFSPYL